MTLASQKNEEIKDAIETLFATKPDWVKFYREVMGLQGLVREAFPTMEAMAEFEQTETYRQIHRMVTELRRQAPPEDLEEEATKVITVRIPQSLHEALRIEAYEHHTSMNKLCISKLLQFIDGENVPAAIVEKKTEAGV
jgi:predicted HicB family RNase H-like nuclease